LSAPSYTPQLRPLGVGETLDAGFRLLRHRFGALVACSLPWLIPFTIIGAIVQGSIDENAFDLNTTTTTSDDAGTAAAGQLVGGIIQGIATVFVIGACLRIVSSAYLGEHVTAGEAIRDALRRAVALFTTYILVGLILLPAFLIVIIAPITFLLLFLDLWIAIKLCVVFPALVFERIGPPTAVARSWRLTGGHWWRLFGTLIVAGLITVVLQLVLGGVAGGVLATSDTVSELTTAIVITAVNLIVLALTYPLIAAIVCVMYFDLRVRNEGFDLQLMAQGLGTGTRFQSAPERPVAPPPDAGGGGFVPPEEPAARS
jgi:hypothetical protein